MVALDVDPLRRAAQYVVRQAKGIEHRGADDHAVRPQGGIRAHPDPEGKIPKKLQKHGERAQNDRAQGIALRLCREALCHLLVVLHVGKTELAAGRAEQQSVAVHAKDVSDHRHEQNPTVFHVHTSPCPGYYYS